MTNETTGSDDSMTETCRSEISVGAGRRADAFNIALIAVLWIAIAVAVNPLGSFPLDDDWEYGKSVQTLLATGRFIPHDFAAMNLLPQIYWGALFCLPFGFSFTALRFSTLVLGLAGILAVYGLLREFRARPPVALAGALAIAMNPIYLGLSHTFMTDVPFFSLFTLSIWAFCRGLRRPSNIILLAGLAAAVLALLIRQFGLALFVSFGCAYIFKRKPTIKNILMGMAIAASGIAVQLYYQHWLRTTGRMPRFYGQADISAILSSPLSELFMLFLQRLLDFAVYVGMFLAPVLLLEAVPLFRSGTSRRKRRRICGLAGFSAAALIFLGMSDRWVPITRNIMSETGLMQTVLRDAAFGATVFGQPPGLRILWLALTAIGVIGAGILFGLLFLGGRRILRDGAAAPRPDKWPLALAWIAAAVYFAVIVPQNFFDRYLLPFCPLFLLLAVVLGAEASASRRIPRTLLAASFIALAIYGGLAAGMTHDYLNWNRIRWEALSSLKEEFGIAPNEIDGGYEFNGWYGYRRDYRMTPGKSWWWVEGDQYSIVFGPIPGYEVLKTYRLKRWLPFGPETILAVRKSAPSPGRAP